jgi:hypothetical protein
MIMIVYNYGMAAVLMRWWWPVSHVDLLAAFKSARVESRFFPLSDRILYVLNRNTFITSRNTDYVARQW